MRKLLALAVAGQMALAMAYDNNPYGVVSHIAWANRDEPIETTRMMGACHLGWNRVDCSWTNVEPASNRWNFTMFETAVEACKREGITVLPILSWNNVMPAAQCLEPWKDEHAWRYARYVKEIVKRFSATMPVIEVINEPNSKDPLQYTQILKTAATAAREENKAITIAFAGMSGVPVGFIETVYKAGGKDYFDIMNIHPYSPDFAQRPENHLEAEIGKARQVMNKYGDNDKPIWITETGWASQQESHLDDGGVIMAGLKAIRPEQKTWRVVYAGVAGTETDLDEELAKGPLLELFPVGSTCVSRYGEALKKGLENGEFDVVVYPFGENCPWETHAAVREFVKRGGVLIDLGGAPIWTGCVMNRIGVMEANESLPMQTEMSKLRMGLTCYWKDKSYTEHWYNMGPTAALPKPTFKRTPQAMYLFTPKELKAGDDFIPLLSAGKTKDGKAIIGAAAYRFNSDYKGGMILSGVRMSMGMRNTEERQALMLPRAMMIAFSSGVEKFFWYEFHAREGDRTDQESHFGITRKNHVPKPAFCTYKTLIDRRPAGSEQLKGEWHNDTGDYYPAWRRPDGRIGGALWTLRAPYTLSLPAENENAFVFHNVYGLKIFPPYRDGAYDLKVSSSPVYYEYVGENPARKPLYPIEALLPGRQAMIATAAPKTIEKVREVFKQVRAALPTAFAASENTMQYERIVKRLEIAERLIGFVESELKKGDVSSVGVAELGLGDLRRFCKYFSDELRLWGEYPLNPSVTPQIIKLRDFGAIGDGKANDSAAFAKAIAAAKALNGKPSIIEIAAGDYLLNDRVKCPDAPRDRNLDSHLLFDALTNCVIRGVSPEKVNIILGDYECSGTLSYRSQNMTFANVNMYYAETPFCQGTVLSRDMSPTAGWAIIEHDALTLKPDDPRFKSSSIPVCAQFTAAGKQLLKPAVFYNLKSEALGGNKYKVYFDTNRAAFRNGAAEVPIGGKLILPNRNDSLESNKARLSEYCNYENVWVRNSRCAAFSISGGISMTGYKCRVFPLRPEFKLSTNADTFFNSRGSYLSHCSFRNQNDDGCNSHSRGRIICSVTPDGHTIYQRPSGGHTREGDLVQVIRPLTGEFVAQVHVESVNTLKWRDGNVEAIRVKERLPQGIRSFDSLALKELSPAEIQKISLGLNKTLDIPDFIYLPQAYGVGFVVYDNSIGNLRNVGVQIQCPNTLVEKNKIDTIHTAIEISCLLCWIEGPAPYNVWIKDNDIAGVGIGVSTSYGWPGAAKFVTTPFRGIAIENNRFDDIIGQWINLNCVADSLVSGNKVTTARAAKLGEIENVELKDNQVTIKK